MKKNNKAVIFGLFFLVSIIFAGYASLELVNSNINTVAKYLISIYLFIIPVFTVYFYKKQ